MVGFNIRSTKRYRDYWFKEKMQRSLDQGKDAEIIGNSNGGSRKGYKNHW